MLNSDLKISSVGRNVSNLNGFDIRTRFKTKPDP